RNGVPAVRGGEAQARRRQDHRRSWDRKPEADRPRLMETKSIDRLIVNSPYDEPERYWRYNRDSRTFTLVEGERRPAGYVVASEGSRTFDDPGVFVPIPLVNQIRPRVKAWRNAGY